MNILVINSVFNIGSTGRIAADLCKEAMEQGHKVLMAYGRGPHNNSNIPSIRIGNKFDFYLHVLISRLFDLHGFGSKRPTRIFLRQVEKFKPDVIHLHNIHGYYINIELLFKYIKRNENIQVLWTFHDLWPCTGHCGSGEEVECRKWENGCYKCPLKKYYPKSIFLDNSKQNFQRKKQLFSNVKNLKIISPSNWLASQVEKSFMSKYQVEVRRNKIDLSAFKPIDSNFRIRYEIVDKFIILCVLFANNKWKYNDLLELSTHLNKSEIIILVGLSKKEIKRLPSNVIGLERTNSKKDLAEIYTTADVFINPTYSDNYPTVNLEAQACGTPVITYNTGGSPETLRAGMGYVIPKGSVRELLGVIRSLQSSSLYKDIDRYDD